MQIKELYENEIEFLNKTLDRCKADVSGNNLVSYHYNGTEKVAEVSPKIEAYNKVFDMYLKILNDYKELSKGK